MPIVWRGFCCIKIFLSRMPKPFVHISYIIILLYAKTMPLLKLVKLQAESKIVFSNYTIVHEGQLWLQ